VVELLPGTDKAGRMAQVPLTFARNLVAAGMIAGGSRRVHCKVALPA
jgi:hypothetical protein